MHVRPKNQLFPLAEIIGQKFDFLAVWDDCKMVHLLNECVLGLAERTGLTHDF
jgi:hypothetical protein